ncbi:MAG: DUF5685 family protein [Lachnospiraceae bacterium]|nr:DUF5685 family protein [Lachnospiraceae bacterium]
MFGYVTIHQPELKFREYDFYRSYYCGLCHRLGQKCGPLGRLSLTYDMTFLTLLLTSLYESADQPEKVRCIAHPVMPHVERSNRYTDYAADMNLLLTRYKCLDDWQDDHDLIKRSYAGLLGSEVKRIEDAYPKKAALIRDRLAALSECEKRGEMQSDLPAGIFGEITAEIFAYQSDVWEETLREMGFYLGKFIYLADAYEDLEKDIKSGSYNPLVELSKEEDYETACEKTLTMMIAHSCQAFERLPIIENIDILRNILYAGVWTRYRIARQKKEEQKNV